MSDVSGHGVPAALVTMAAKQTYQTQTIFKRTPVDFFQYINEEIYNRITTSDFLTAFNLYFTSSTDLIYAGAGHPPAYLIRHNSQEIQELTTHGVLLGAFLQVNRQFEEKRIKIYPGDRVVLFTDGILEQLNEKGEQFGEKRLKELLIRYAELELPEMVDKIVSHVDTFRGQVPLQDDLTILVVQLSPHYDRAQEFAVLGRQAMEAEDYSESLRYGRRIYELIPYLPEGVFLIGVSLYYLKRYDEAIPYLKQYLRKFLDSVTTVGYMYFRSLLEMGRRDEAVAYGKRIIFEDMPVTFYEELYEESVRMLRDKEGFH
jgi:sigma-B regulation protein RsbU (phosphoserine phosphatase)